jgi:hypothetical protein
METLGGAEVTATHRSAVAGPRALAAAVVLVLAALLGLPGEARAVKVTLLPPDTTVAVGDIVTLRAVTDAFPDLKAFQLIYRYDPLRLQFLGATAGEVLTSVPHVAFVTPDEPPADSVIYDAAVLVGSTSGPGVLVYLRFRALAVGDAAIECMLADFRDSQNRQTLPACNGGRVQITAPTPVQRSTWSKIKAIYR